MPALTDQQVVELLERRAADVVRLGREWRHRRSRKTYVVTDVVLDANRGAGLGASVIYQATRDKGLRFSMSAGQFTDEFEPT